MSSFPNSIFGWSGALEEGGTPAKPPNFDAIQSELKCQLYVPALTEFPKLPDLLPCGWVFDECH